MLRRVLAVILCLLVLLSLGYGVPAIRRTREDNWFRFKRAGEHYTVCVYHAHQAFGTAAISEGVERIEEIRRAGGWIMAARYAAFGLDNEASRQGIKVAGITYFYAVNGEELISYSGAQDEELERRIQVIVTNVRLINASLDRELFASRNKQRIDRKSVV